MSSERAISNLELPENEPLRWLFGSVLKKRATLEIWDCTPLRFLQENGNLVIRLYWNEVICEYRDSLDNPADAPKKVDDELNSESELFDQALHDFMGEIICTRHLRRQGYEKCRVQLRLPKSSTPDFYVQTAEDGSWVPVEFKNLRTTRSADAVLRDAFVERSGSRRGEGMNVALVNNPPYFLNEQEADSLRNWAMHLKLESGVHQFALSDGGTVTVRLDMGKGDLREERYISDFELDSGVLEGLYKKAKRVIEESIRTKSVMRERGKSIAVLRWCVPNEALLWSRFLSSELQRRLRAEYRAVDAGLEIHVFTDWDHQEDKLT
ncbi:MAG: hypothetical protein LAO78_20575 [Acidobacteriia bacterium]|nr:hypothetical protein [Terriglobia bacterium]